MRRRPQGWSSVLVDVGDENSKDDIGESTRLSIRLKDVHYSLVKLTDYTY